MIPPTLVIVKYIPVACITQACMKKVQIQSQSNVCSSKEVKNLLCIHEHDYVWLLLMQHACPHRMTFPQPGIYATHIISFFRANPTIPFVCKEVEIITTPTAKCVITKPNMVKPAGPDVRSCLSAFLYPVPKEGEVYGLPKNLIC